MGAKQITHMTFIDVETTGLIGPNVKPYADQIVEVAAAKVNIRTRQIEAWYETLITPEGDQTLEHEHNGVHAWNFGAYHLDRGTFHDVSDEEWMMAPSLEMALAHLIPFLGDATLAGNNPAFDRDHIIRDFMGMPFPMPSLDYHLIDLCSPAMLLVMAGASDGVSLKNSRVWAGLPGEQAHRAGQDVKDAIQVFFKMADVMQAGTRWLANGWPMSWVGIPQRKPDPDVVSLTMSSPELVLGQAMSVKDIKNELFQEPLIRESSPHPRDRGHGWDRGTDPADPRNPVHQDADEMDLVQNYPNPRRF